MTRGQLKRLLIAIMSGMLIMIILLNLSMQKNYEVSTDFSYELFNKNLKGKQKDYANRIIKECKDFLDGVNAYSENIDFNLIYQDSIESQVVKTEYLKNLSKPANKPYIDELRKYFDAKFIHIYGYNNPNKKEITEVKYRAILKVEYLDLEKNYKIFKNKQYSNEIDSNIEFLDYLKIKENVVISTKIINDYDIVYDIVNDKNKYSSMAEVLTLQIPVTNTTQTIEEQLDKITYDISSEAMPENVELFSKGKETADKVVQDITEKNYLKLSQDNESLYRRDVATKLTKYMTKFINYYKESDLVKFVEQESKLRFVGYNNTNKSLIYEIEEYPYSEIVKVFITETQSSEVLTKANNFTLFKKLVDSNEIKKTKRIVEIPVDSNGLLLESLLIQLMPDESYLWNNEELEFSGLVSVKPSELPGDYTSYFTVQAMNGIGEHVGVIYVPRSSFKTYNEYIQYIDEKVSKTLSIILGVETENVTTYYKEEYEKLYSKFVSGVLDKMGQTKDIKFDRQNTSLNGVEVISRISDSGFTLIVKCDNWEVTEE